MTCARCNTTRTARTPYLTVEKITLVNLFSLYLGPRGSYSTQPERVMTVLGYVLPWFYRALDLLQLFRQSSTCIARMGHRQAT